MHSSKLATLIVFSCFLVSAIATPQTKFTHQQYEEDFDYLWQTMSNEYAYFDKKQTDWDKVREIYRPRIAALTKPDDFVALLRERLSLLKSGRHRLLKTPPDPTDFL
jgi:hypothetical protein